MGHDMIFYCRSDRDCVASIRAKCNEAVLEVSLWSNKLTKSMISQTWSSRADPEKGICEREI